MPDQHREQKMFKQVFVLIVAAKICVMGQNESVLKTISDGVIRGQVKTTIKNNRPYHKFISVPFAKPPVGDLRFADPVKIPPWTGIYDATYNRPQCIQFATGDTTTEPVGDEDCLHITVYSPVDAADLPVLVWFYGGAFLFGNCSSDFYGPDDFLEQDLVFVTFNYRLGVFGFLSTGDEACPGNWGLKDQILALNWVRNNIAFFGGNPDKVTIFGESAGAASVHLMMQTPLTKGLFRSAIMNSGTSANLWSLNTRACENSASLAIALGIITLNNTCLVERLRTVDAYQLYTTARITSTALYLENPYRGLTWAPVIEPVAPRAVYTKASCNALSQGDFIRVPVLMGTNSNEGATFGDVDLILKPFLVVYDVGKQNLAPYSMTKDITKRYLAGAEIEHFYFGACPIVTSEKSYIELTSDDQFNRGIRQAAKFMSLWTTVYYYVFGYEGKSIKPYKGVAHGEELGYLFTFLNERKTDTTDIKVSEMLVKLWSNFVKQCDPTPSEDPALNNTRWSPVNGTARNFNYMSLNESMVEAVNPRQISWEFYAALWNKYGDNIPSEMTTY